MKFKEFDRIPNIQKTEKELKCTCSEGEECSNCYETKRVVPNIMDEINSENTNDKILEELKKISSYLKYIEIKMDTLVADKKPYLKG